MTDFEAALDELASRLFDGPSGRARLAPLLARFDAEMDRLHDDDESFALLQAIRLDWALCDASVDEDGPPGDTWAHRAAAGQVEGVAAQPVYRLLARSITGLFEVWSGHPTWLRDRVRGLCMPLARPTAPWLPATDGVAALWELRLVLDEDGAHLCRPALEYPLEILPILQRAHDRRFAGGSGSLRSVEPLALQRLRRSRLRWRRAGRGEPVGYFSHLAP